MYSLGAWRPLPRLRRSDSHKRFLTLILGSPSCGKRPPVTRDNQHDTSNVQQAAADLLIWANGGRILGVWEAMHLVML